MLQTFQQKRDQYHSNILTDSVSLFDEIARKRIADLTNYFLHHGVSDAATAQHQAIVAIAGRLRQQANIMAFSDTFYLLGVALVVALVASLLLKKTGQVSGAGVH